MNISYKKLWKLLIDKDMKKKDLKAATGISQKSIAKLSKRCVLCAYPASKYNEGDKNEFGCKYQ